MQITINSYIADEIFAVGFLSKLSVSVLVIWVVIGVSLATLYPLAENIKDQTGIGSGDLQLGPGSGNSQTGNDSEDLQSGTGSESIQTVNGSDNSNGVNPGDPGNLGDPGTGSGNKYSVDHFILNLLGLNFTAEITNPQDRVTGNGYYEIKTGRGANHDQVLQNGTFPHSNGVFNISYPLIFIPTGNEYTILVYSGYPDNNRVSKAQNESGT